MKGPEDGIWGRPNQNQNSTVILVVACLAVRQSIRLLLCCAKHVRFGAVFAPTLLLAGH